MKKRWFKLLCLCLCFCFCLPLLPSCQRADVMAQNGIRAVEIVQKKKSCEIDILVTMNAATLEQHKDQKLCLYELFPGETLEDLADKEPVAEKKANGSLKFRIPMQENGANRLYSAFAVAFSDGTLLSEKTASVKNPEAIAEDTGRFPWGGTPKGILTEQMEEGWSMGATHTTVSLRLSEWLDGTTTLRFNDRQYVYSNACYSKLLDRLYQAQKTGAQVSLEVILDVAPDLEAVAAMLETLSDIKTMDEENGRISAWVITPAPEIDRVYTAEVARLARLALVSRVASGRIYLHLKGQSYSETAETFSLLSGALSERGVTEWGAMISPDCSTTPWESSEKESVTVDKLLPLFQYLKSGKLASTPSYLAVSGISYSAADEDLQAAMLAYTYRRSVSAGASLVLYDETAGAEYSLSNEDGSPRRAKRIFETMDLGLSSEDLATVESLSLGGYSRLSETVSRKSLTGSASAGSDGQKTQILFDFSDGQDRDFTAVNGLTLPKVADSESMGHAVLYTWLTATAEGGEGVRKLLSDGKELENAFSISLCLLLQNLETPTSTVTLRLDGVSKNGTQRISFEASAELTNDSRWQTAIFYVGSFVAEADLSQPCVMTLTADTESPEGTEYLMWLDSVSVRKPERQLGTLVTVLISLGSVAVGFAILILIYKLSAKKKRAARYRR